ncbi:MAG TPA: hypothetical protein VLE27_04150, partial [Thermoanaerobaculia bacterium]|nr:hypothetical protein [Thermoanaerobaculia bacterium]
MITVDSASPLADEQPPKDPWEVLRSTPGVLTDRINIGGMGSCTASASPFMAAGATAGQGFPQATETTFSGNLIERFFLQDYSFSLAREAPVRKDELVSLELVADLRRRRGTDEWKASGFSLGGYGPEAANYIDSLRAISADVGGPLVVDRLWIWGGAGLHDLEQVVLGGQKEGREVAAGSLKLNSQIRQNTSVILATTRGDSEGDNAGAAPDRAPETTWDETGDDAAWTAEAAVVASSDFYSTLNVGGVDRRLEQDSQVFGAAARIGADGVARGSWFGWDEELRKRHVRLDSTLFAVTGPIHHEIVSGAGWRREDEERALTPPGPLAVAGNVFNLPGTRALAELWRAGEVRARTETLGLWAQDTLTTGGWTGLLGLYADRQDLGIDGGPRPWTLAPRLQLSRHVDHDGHWIVTFLLGRSASQLGPRAAWHVDGGEAVARPLLFSDLDGDLFLDPGEPLQVLPGNGFDPLRPGVDADAVDSRLRPEITDQAILSIETELMEGGFQVGFQLIWRRTRDLLEERLLVRDL